MLHSQKLCKGRSIVQMTITENELIESVIRFLLIIHVVNQFIDEMPDRDSFQIIHYLL